MAVFIELQNGKVKRVNGTLKGSLDRCSKGNGRRTRGSCGEYKAWSLIEAHRARKQFAANRRQIIAAAMAELWQD